MSLVYLTAIPTDPRWMPDTQQEAAAVAVFARLVPHRGDIEIDRNNRVVLYDAGDCFETVSCPACGAVLAENPTDMTWFVEQTDRSWTEDTGFWPQDVVTPCCRTDTTLNDLTYRTEQGFASWAMRAENAQTWELHPTGRADLEAALGHPVRLVYSHY